MLLEGQLDEATDEFSLPEESEEVSLEADDSPDDPLSPPPLQEITRRLKYNTIRKKRSFFIYFP